MAKTKREPAEKNLGGRPTLYREEYNEQVYKLCLLGATDKEIANFFGIEESTLNNWKLNHPKFMESIKESKAQFDNKVERALYERALGYDYYEEVATREGVVEIRKKAHSDTTAAIFWLKNRRPKEWRDKQEQVNYNITNDEMTLEQAEEILKLAGVEKQWIK